MKDLPIHFYYYLQEQGFLIPVINLVFFIAIFYIFLSVYRKKYIYIIIIIPLTFFIYVVNKYPENLPNISYKKDINSAQILNKYLSEKEKVNEDIKYDIYDHFQINEEKRNDYLNRIAKMKDHQIEEYIRLRYKDLFNDQQINEIIDKTFILVKEIRNNQDHDLVK